MDHDRDETAFWCILIGGVIFNLAVWGIVVYVALHFILKAW